MKKVKALVVEHEESSRQAIDEILCTLGHRYDLATSLAEARELLAENGYAYVLLGYAVPARVGGTPRIQNTENFLDDLECIKHEAKPKVIVMCNRMPEIDDEDKLRWAADMRSRGATTFICKPFRTGGRTLDRVIKKILAGRPEAIRLKARQAVPAEAPNIVPTGPLPKGPGETIAASAEDGNGEAVVEPGSPEANGQADRYPGIPNEPIELGEFMARFCQERSKQNRVCRKKALLAAARHGTVELPELAAPHKHGKSKMYFVHDLLATWQGFLDEGVDLPPLLVDPASTETTSSRG